jgi:BirA family biotin operon repressor/biotin-[acetyl-CoA-carboxylase] ligase
MNSPLHAERIASLSSAPALGLDIEVVATTGSTNADLRARLETLTRPLLLAAEAQSAGRGRAGRSWLAAAGDSLCFSLAWKFAGPITQLTGLPLAVGVVLAETLAAAGWPVKLKWPNDLLKEGVKLGGILIESALVRSAPAAAPQIWAVIGVGLNTRNNPALTAAVGNDIAALSSEPVDRDALLASLATALAGALPQFDALGLAPFAARWEALHAHAGQPVMILEGGQIREQGIAFGIDASGCLLLDTVAGRIAVSVGDVSLRSGNIDGANHAAD